MSCVNELTCFRSHPFMNNEKTSRSIYSVILYNDWLSIYMKTSLTMIVYLYSGICATSALITYAAVMQHQNAESNTPYEFGIGFYLGWAMPICYFISAFCMTLDDMIHSITNDCCLMCRRGGKHKSAAHVWHESQQHMCNRRVSQVTEVRWLRSCDPGQVTEVSCVGLPIDSCALLRKPI